MSDIKTSLVKASKTESGRSAARSAKNIAIGVGIGYSLATFGLLITGVGAGAFVIYKGWRWLKKKAPSKDPK